MATVEIASKPVLTKLTVKIVDDQDPDTSYLLQKEFTDRQTAYNRGDFSFVGIYVTAETTVFYPERNWGTTQSFRSAGLWGIESDSGIEYFQQVAHDEALSLVGEPQAYNVNLDNYGKLETAALQAIDA